MLFKFNLKIIKSFATLYAVMTYATISLVLGTKVDPHAAVLSATLPAATFSLAVAYAGEDYIYLFGGFHYNINPPRKEILRYTISTNTITVVGELPYGIYAATTTLDSDGNVFIFGGICFAWCDARTVLKFDTFNHHVELLPTLLPLPDSTRINSIVAYQEDANASAYSMALVGSGVNTTFYLIKMENGIASTLRNYTNLRREEPIIVEAMELIGGGGVFLKVRYRDGSRIFQLNLNDHSVREHAGSSAHHNKFSMSSGSGLWHLLPIANPNGVIENCDVLHNTWTSRPLTDYPEILLLKLSFRYPAIIYITTLNRMYIFGGEWETRDSLWEFTNMIWTIDVPEVEHSTSAMTTPAGPGSTEIIEAPHGNPVATFLNISLPGPCANPAASYTGNAYIYLFGGVTDIRDIPSKRILRFCISTASLEQVGELPFWHFGGVTVLDSLGNIYIMGGMWEGQRNVILQFQTNATTIQEVDFVLPYPYSWNSIVAYQIGSQSPAYIAASHGLNTTILTIMTFKDGMLEILQNVTLSQEYTGFLPHIMESFDDNNVLFIAGYTFQSGSQILRVNLEYGTVTHHAGLPVQYGGIVNNYGTAGFWQIIPMYNTGGVLHVFDVLGKWLTSWPIVDYPQDFIEKTFFEGAAYVYIHDFRRMYVFGGQYLEDGHPIFLSTIWTIQMPGGSTPSVVDTTEHTGPGGLDVEVAQGDRSVVIMVLALGGCIFTFVVIGSTACYYIPRNKPIRRKIEVPDLRGLQQYLQERCRDSEDRGQVTKKATDEIRETQLVIFQRILGEGYFGEVRKGVFFTTGSTAVDVAVKQLKTGLGITRELLVEIETMQMVGFHPNVVQFFGAVTKGGNAKIVLEYCENGSLWSYLRRARSSYREGHSEYSKRCFGDGPDLLAGYLPAEPTKINEVTFGNLMDWGCQIALGMEYLGTRNIIHRDLAARNILLDANLKAKVSDFGLSRCVLPTKSLGSVFHQYYRSRQNRPMPYAWLSIEALETQMFTIKSDVWAFGVTLWEIFSFCGSTPYDGKGKEDVLKVLNRGGRLQKPGFAPDQIFDIMSSCWSKDPACRPTFSFLEQCLQDAATVSKSFENDLIEGFSIRHTGQPLN